GEYITPPTTGGSHRSSTRIFWTSNLSGGRRREVGTPLPHDRASRTDEAPERALRTTRAARSGCAVRDFRPRRNQAVAKRVQTATNANIAAATAWATQI